PRTASTRPSSTPGRSSSSPAPTRSLATAARPPRPTPRPRRPSCSSRSAASRWSWSGSKKKSGRSPERLRPLVEPDHPELSVRRQCALLGLSRASWYYEPAAEAAEDLRLMRLIDEEYTAHPFLRSRRLTRWLSGP